MVPAETGDDRRGAEGPSAESGERGRPSPRLRGPQSEPTPPKQPRLRRPGASAKEGGPLVCRNDDVEVPADDARCLHPSSQCRFREWCEVMEIVRARRRAEGKTERE